MKPIKLTFVLIFFAFSSITNAQIFVNGQPFECNKKYLLVITNTLGTYAKVIYGQKIKFLDIFTKKYIVTDTQGNPLRFNYLGDLIEFFEKNNWTFLTLYPVDKDGETDNLVLLLLNNNYLREQNQPVTDTIIISQ